MKCLMITGFHRSATSATAKQFFDSGLFLGDALMGPHISNVSGHYEDMDAVAIHDAALRKANTSWQFCQEVPLEGLPVTSLNDFVESRFERNDVWGFKDPRTLLFLPSWKEVLGERLAMVGVLRHWSCCIESLLHRHSRTLAHSLLTISPDSSDFAFWRDPSLAARMWLAYNERLLAFVKDNPDQCLLVTQRALFNGAPLISRANQRFGLSLNESVPSVFRAELLRDTASDRILQQLPRTLVARLDRCWNQLLELCDFRSDDEMPQWTRPETTAGQDLDAFIEKVSLTSSSQSGGVSLSEQAEYPTVDLSALKPDEADIWLKELSVSSWSEDVVIALVEELKVHYPTQPALLLAFAHKLMQAGFWTVSISVLEWVLSRGLIIPHIFCDIAYCYRMLGDFAQGNYYADIAIERNPNNPRFYFESTWNLIRLNRYDEAIVRAERALALDANPNHALCLAHAYEAKGNYEAARSTVEPYKAIGHSGIEQLLVRLAYRSDKVLGDAAYREATLSALSSEDRFKWLADTLSLVESRVFEEDLFSRVQGHWREIGFNEPA